jgi:hypothetical protein
MGVFPLADTQTFTSNPPPAHGGNSRAPHGWRPGNARWHAHRTTTPRRHAAAARAPIHYIADIADPVTLTYPTGPGPLLRAVSAGCIRRGSTLRTSQRTVGLPAERGPPFATSGVLAHRSPARMRYSSPVAASQFPFAAGGTRMQ